MPPSPRYIRQVILAEVGAAGQERLGAATAAVGGDGPAHAVATRYAEAAGFAAVAPGPLDVDALAPEEIVRTEAARALLAGARATLAEIRAALGPAALSPTKR